LNTHLNRHEQLALPVKLQPYVKYIYIFIYVDNGFAPIFTGHEPVMLLLHQPTIANLRGTRTLVCSDENTMS
jgi:hypothetical protein